MAMWVQNPKHCLKSHSRYVAQANFSSSIVVFFNSKQDCKSWKSQKNIVTADQTTR